MAFRRFNSIFRHINKDIKHRNLLYNHQHFFLFTQRINKPSSSIHSNLNHNHIFNTPYSSQINSIYSQCFIFIQNHIKRNYHHLNHQSSFFNIHRNHKYRNKHNHNHLFFKRFASMDVGKDYYKILGVNKNAPKKEIRSSYLKLAKTWHPDLHKNDKEKEKARAKFIEVQEAYEVLHDDGMRKKYDEMRRYGVSQEQYKHQEAYEKYTGQKARGFTGPYTYQQSGRGANAYGNAWEDEFRRNMQQEWEKIRREQQDWASARRQERHKYSDQFPFGNPHMRNQTPFGQQGGPFGQQGPFGFGGPGQPGGPFGGPGDMPQDPFGGFLRTMIYVFAFFMAFRLLGLILFGPRDRRGGPYGPGHDPFADRRGTRDDVYWNNPDEYGRYNHRFPPPLSLRNKDRKRNSLNGGRYDDESEIDEYDRNRKLRRGKYVPPPPSMEHRRKQQAEKQRKQRENSPKPRNALKDDRRRITGKERGLDEGDGNKTTFWDPSEQQTTDVSSPQEQRRREKKKRSKYEKMLEEQRMMEDLYIRARRKQLEEQEYERQRKMNKRFGKRGISGRSPQGTVGKGEGGDDDEDVNKAWERYLNSKSGNEVNWRDR